MKKITFLLFLFFTKVCLYAQVLTPVKWSFSSKELSHNEAELLLTAEIEAGWHIYSLNIEEGGPIATSFKFNPSDEYKLLGKITESPKAISAFDNAFSMKIAWHEKTVTFKQRIKLTNPKATIKGKLEYMACDDGHCLPPEELDFAINVNTQNSNTREQETNTLPSNPALSSSGDIIPSPQISNVPLKNDSIKENGADSIKPKRKSDKNVNQSLWTIFLAGFAGGLFAFFMPCIYPMIPLTVSFFTKRSGSRAKGIKSALIYGLSIIIIYVLLGLIVTAIFGASALNDLASSALFNLLFFGVIVVFALSFLGAFEINLPSSLVNKANEKSDQGGFLGLFFMAFTLALVSFSCTGPIIGYLLVETVSKGVKLGPAIGMFGFSAALAIPFTLFAIFPSWLKELPKSGGWMNAVKVSLGFLELALAFKFLSNVDLAYHWGILNRDIFLIIWIVIFGLWGMYLLGKIRLSHDSDLAFIPLIRLFFAMLVLGFTVYLIPGLWGAPLNSLSGWLPPPGSQEFNLYLAPTSNQSGTNTVKKYQNLFHAPHGIDVFYDYDEGLAHAKKVNKPVMLDFTGHSCANCRRMEQSVWSAPEVLKRLKNDYVLISLYVDDRTELPEKEKFTSKSGKEIKTLGQKWSDLQTQRFETNSQPFYVIVDQDGKALVPPQAFDLDINNYIKFLDSGKSAFSTLIK